MKALHLVAAVVLIAVAARFDVAIPGSPVPQSLQTLAILVVGALLGARWGASALGAYLVVGAAGLPVFAGGAGGLAAATGPTAGYLVGFVVGAALVGWLAERGHTRRFAPAFAVLCLGHLVILVVGWGWLARSLGAGPAWTGGVAPFLYGGVVKSVAGAIVIGLARRARGSGPIVGPTAVPEPSGTAPPA